MTSWKIGTRERSNSLRKLVLMMLRYTYWGAEIAENPPSVHYDEIMADDKGVGKWTDKIVRCPASLNQ